MPNQASASSTAPRLPLDRRFGYRFHMLSRALGQQMLVHVGRQYGLNLAEYRIMTVLADRKSPSIKDIAAHTDLDKAHITRALASLAERGFASQKIDARDRRLRDVKLTPAGWSVINRLELYVMARQKRLERRLTRSELDILWKAIAMLSEEVNKLLAEEEQTSAVRRRRAAIGERAAALGPRKLAP